MAGITLTEAETHLTTWLEADKAVAKGQSFSISGKTYTRADASVIRENIFSCCQEETPDNTIINQSFLNLSSLK